MIIFFSVSFAKVATYIFKTDQILVALTFNTQIAQMLGTCSKDDILISLNSFD